MQVILLQKVEHLGDLGSLVKVKPGFARNFLIPKGKAALATAANLAEFEQRRAELEAQATTARAQAARRQQALDGLRVIIRCKAGDEGKLYGSIGTADVAEAVTQASIPVDKREVRLAEDGPLRRLGEYTVVLHLHTEFNANVTVVLEAE